MYRSTLLLVGILALGNSASAVPRLPPTLAFVGPVKSPLVKDLAAALGPVVRPRDPRATLLVVDGDAYAGTMAEEDMLRKAWRVGKGLLILDADEGDLRGDLIRLTGFVPSESVAAVYLRKRPDGGIDQVHLDRNATRLDSIGRRTRQAFLRKVEKAFREGLPVRPLQSTTVAEGRGEKDQVDPSETPQFHSGPFLYSQVSAPLPQVVGSIPGDFFSDPTPVPQQPVALTMNEQVDIYGSLFNDNSGQTTPTAYIVYQGQHQGSIEAFDSFGANVSGNVYGYALPVQGLELAVAVGGDDGLSLTPYSSEPNNAENQATLTSGASFSLGFGPQGPNAGVNYSTATTSVLTGWTVTKTTPSSSDPTQNTINWLYQEQLDNNNNNMTTIFSNLFSMGSTTVSLFGMSFGNEGVNYSPSAIASNGLASNPVAVWTTPGSPDPQTVAIQATMSAQPIYWLYDDPFIGANSVTWYTASPSTVSNYAFVHISLVDIWNQMGTLSSISVPPTVSPDTLVPLTVTLDHQAPVANGGMAVSVISSIPALINDMNLLVPSGQKTFTFEVPIEVNPGVATDVTLTVTVNGLSMSTTTSVVPPSS